MNAVSKYREQGARAFTSNQTRESCRYKAADIVREWTAGWDDAQARTAESKRKAAIPRWEEYGSRGWGPDRTPPTEYCLSGDAPRIIVHHKQYEDQTVWFVSCHGYGIEDERLGAYDSVTAKRQAILRVREILLMRRTALLEISDPETGDLLSEVGS
jgi:ribosome modulation factor